MTALYTFRFVGGYDVANGSHGQVFKHTLDVLVDLVLVVDYFHWPDFGDYCAQGVVLIIILKCAQIAFKGANIKITDAHIGLAILIIETDGHDILGLITVFFGVVKSAFREDVVDDSVRYQRLLLV